MKFYIIYILVLLFLILSFAVQLRADPKEPIRLYYKIDHPLIGDIPPVVKTLPPILGKIAWCESRNRQFNPDGSVHRGEINPQDIGKWQINTKYWLELSIQLGYDIYTEQGNTNMALYIYEHYGTKPWNWSKNCWNVSSL